jgi:hypothetical protein
MNNSRRKWYGIERKCTGAGALDHAVVEREKRYQKSLSNRVRCVQVR